MKETKTEDMSGTGTEVQKPGGGISAAQVTAGAVKSEGENGTGTEAHIPADRSLAAQATAGAVTETATEAEAEAEGENPADRTVRFSYLAAMLDAMSRTRRPALKKKHLHTFLDDVYGRASPPLGSFFGPVRLMLPKLDRERANFGLREGLLAK